jgi:hypothetical protein
MKSTVEESPTAFWEREVLKARVGWLDKDVVVSGGSFVGERVRRGL